MSCVYICSSLKIVFAWSRKSFRNDASLLSFGGIHELRNGGGRLNVADLISGFVVVFNVEVIEYPFPETKS